MKKSLVPLGLLGALVNNGLARKKMSEKHEINKEKAWML